MVFPRNVGFGRCYLVSTRHEILFNIDRNAKPNRNSAAAPKKPEWNKSRESADPTPAFGCLKHLFSTRGGDSTYEMGGQNAIIFSREGLVSP